MKYSIRKIIRAAAAALLSLTIAAGTAAGTSVFTRDTAVVTYAANKVYESNAEAAVYIRDRLKACATEITYTVKGVFNTNEKAFEFSNLMFNYLAKGYTGDPDGGDILLSRQTVSTYMSSNAYSTTFTETVTPDMTVSQQNAANEAAARIERQLNLSSLSSDYARIKAVHDYLAKNVKYDYTFSKHSLYDALVNKSCVCEGFAKAFYKILNDIGIPCRIMAGRGNGGDHAWNTVYLEGKWYFVDVTWAANYYESNSNIYKWFLKCWKNFSDHSMNDLSTKYWLPAYCDFATSDYTRTTGSSAGFNYPVLTDSGFSLDISKCTASLSYSSYGYDGNAKRPSVTVKDGKKTLKNGTDYTVKYSNNVKPGTATVTITGKGSYGGTLKKTYHIGEVMTSISIPYSSYTYKGTAIKPTVTVKNAAGKKLVLGTDYTLKYSNNTKVGIASITVIGKGKYGGTRTKTFVVKPAKNAITSLTTTKGTFKITWKKATEGAVGYQVLYSTDKNFKNNVHSYTSAKLSDLSENFSRVPNSGETWYIKVRSFYTKDGTTTASRYGNYSDVRSIKVA